MRKRTRFGDFVFDWRSEQLSLRGVALHLQPLPTKLLKVFLDRPGVLIERAELYRLLWPVRVVDLNQSLNFCVRSLRKTLNDQQDPPMFVETIPRRGYRFVCTVSHQNQNLSKWQVGGVALTVIIVVSISTTLAFSRLDNTLPSPAETSYLRAMHLLNRLSPELAARSIPLLEESLTLDPQHGPATAALARAYYLANGSGASELDRVRFLNARALELDPNNAAANTLAGILAFRHDWDLAASSIAFERALAESPEHRYALYWYPLVLAADGKLKRAIHYLDIYLQVDPGRAQTAAHAGWFYALDEDWDAALKHCLAGVELDPRWRMGLECAANAAWKVGRRDLAVTLFERLGETFLPAIPIGPADDASTRLVFYRQLLEWHQQFDPGNLFESARVAMIVGQTEVALAHISEMVRREDPMASLTLTFPEFAPLRDVTLELAKTRLLAGSRTRNP